MGWLFTSSATKKDVVEELTNTNRWTNGNKNYTLLAKRMVGNHLWMVWDYSGIEGGCPGRFIELALLGSDRNYGWGYKNMDHNMGPCEVDCPVKFLDLLKPRDFQSYGIDWAVRVRIHDDKMKKIKALKVGSKVKLVPNCTVLGNPITEATVSSLKPLMAEFNGYTAKLRPRLIAEVL